MQQGERVQSIFNTLVGGSTPTLNFPRDDTLRSRFITLSADIVSSVESRCPLDDQQKEWLVLRLGHFVMKTRILDDPAQAAHLVPQIITSVSAHPDWLENRSMRHILDGHTQHTAQSAARYARTPDRPVALLWHGEDGHHLVELHTPSHLRTAGEAVGHCIGTRYNTEALAFHGVQKGSPESDEYLQYLIEMRRKHCRIFALRGPGGDDLVTMRYDLKSREIDELESREEPTLQDPFFRPLCRALSALSLQIPMGKIHNLPVLTTGKICTTDGDIRSGLPSAKDFFYGTVGITDGISQKKLLELAGNPRLTLDISHFTQTHRLPTHIKADLVSLQEDGKPECLNLSQVVEMANLYSDHKHLELGSLRKCDDLTATKAQTLSLPELKCALTLRFDGPELKAPKLQTARTLYLPSLAGEASLPGLHKVLQIRVGQSAQYPRLLDLPALRHCLFPTILAHEVRLPSLVDCEILELRNMATVTLPRLERAESIELGGVRTLHAPALKEAETLTMFSGVLIDAPVLTKLRQANVKASCTLSAPLLAQKPAYQHAKAKPSPAQPG